MSTSASPAGAGWAGRVALACLYGGGAWLHGGLVVELLDAGSQGSHTLAALRWPGVALGAIGTVVQLVALGHALRGPAVPGRLWRDAFVLLVLAVVAQVLLSPRYKPALFDLAVGGALLVHAALRLGAPALQKLRENRGVRGLDLVAFQVVLFLVVAELGLRVAARVVDTPLLLRDEQGVAGAMATYRPAPGTMRMGFPVNATSHYDEAFEPGAPTVVVLGDSFSQGVVPHHYHYTTVAERELPGARFHNLGYAGTGPGAYLRLLETEALALRPDLVVVSLFVGNDLAESMRWRNRSGILRSFCDRRNVLAFLVPMRLLRVVREGMQDRQQGGGILRRPCEVEFAAPTSDPRRLVAAMPWLADAQKEPPSISEAEYLRIERERAAAIHDAERTGSVGQLFDALAEMRRLAGPVPFALVLIPDEFQVNDALWEQVRQPGFDREQPQPLLRAWCEERGIPCLDLLPILRAATGGPDGTRRLYHLRDTHFNAAGNAAAGRALAEFVRRIR